MEISKTPFFINIPYKNSIFNYTFICRPLSFKEINSLSDLDGQHELNYRICTYGLLKIESSSGEELSISDIPIKYLDKIANKILKKSTLSEETYTTLEKSINIYFAYELQSPTWDCELCQSKNLHKKRNCKLFPKLPKRNDFAMQIGETLYTSCPIYYVNKKLISKAIESYNMFESGFLPDIGGLLDQTILFVKSSFLVSAAINRKNKKEMENLNNK